MWSYTRCWRCSETENQRVTVVWEGLHGRSNLTWAWRLGWEQRRLSAVESVWVKTWRQEPASLCAVWAAGRNTRQMRWKSLDGARSRGAVLTCWALTRRLSVITIIPSAQGSARNNNMSHLYKRPKWNPNNRSSCSKYLPPPAVNILLPDRVTNESGPA